MSARTGDGSLAALTRYRAELTRWLAAQPPARTQTERARQLLAFRTAYAERSATTARRPE
ncbi:hypothetical protein [Microbacterium sp.]|uniref:hypothetical protein n=1 Tax=Microbacterium sp. TaxID=51671 RepID=UPI003F6E66BF